jgi:hypothetical protein
LKIKDFFDIGGGSLLNTKYNGSISQLLAGIFPNYEWLPWNFPYTPKKFWSDRKNMQKLVDWAGKELGVVQFSDWNKKTTRDLVELVGHSVVSHYRSLAQLLAFAYPEDVNIKPKSPYYKKTQSLLKTMLNSMFSQTGRKSVQKCILLFCRSIG